MTDAARTLHGECYCRAVAFKVLDQFEYALICHCGECRRRTGAASKPFAGISSGDLKIVRGEDALVRYGDDLGHHASCGKCGSLLYSLVRQGDYVHVAMGSLVDPPTIVPSGHIFVGSKAPWDLICDDLPQSEGFPTR